MTPDASARFNARDAVPAIARLREAAEGLRALSDRALLDGTAAALASWPGEHGEAARAAEDLAARSGMSASMLRFGIERTVAAHAPTALRRWLRAARREAGPGRRTGPRAVAQVLAGNVAALAVPATIEALLARSAVLVKPASGDPVTAELWVASLRRAAPKIGAAVAVAAWRGGDEAVESAVFGAVDAVVVSGGAASVASVAARSPVPVLAHGPRFSVGIVGEGWRRAGSRPFDAVSREIALWEQAGCLSPRTLLVAGDVERFARRLAAAMERRSRAWPPPPRSPGLAAAVHAARAEVELAGGPAGVLAPDGTAWTVAWSRDVGLGPGPEARFVRVAPLPPRDAAVAALAARSAELQAVGIAGFPPAEARRWAEAIRAAGVPWTAPLAALQDPPAGWRADGRSGLVDLLRLGRIPGGPDSG